MNLRVGWCLTAAMLVALMSSSVPAQNEVTFRVIVHSSNSLDSIAKKEVSRMFLKRRTNWPDGGQVTPVDLSETSPVRRAFSAEVHGRSLDTITNYWVREIFSGKRIPPKELENEAQVLEFVRNNEGAIGYVAVASPGGGVKVLEITE